MGALQALKEIFIRYITTILLIVTIVGLGYFAYRVWKDKKTVEQKYADLIGTQDKYDQLSKYTAKLESDYKTQKDLAAAAQTKFQEVAKAQDEKIAVLSDATYLISRQAGTQQGPDYAFHTPKGTQNLILNEIHIQGEDSPPIGYVIIKSDGTTYKGNYTFEIRVDQLQTVDENTGQVKVYSKAFLVDKENGFLAKRNPNVKRWKDVEYPLNIVGGEAIVDPTQNLPDKHFILWAPRFVGGFNFGAEHGHAIMKPMLGVSLSGYGFSRNDLDWRFIQLGIDNNSELNNLGIDVTFFAVRPLKLFPNLYVGPGVGFDQGGSNLFLNLSLGL